MIDQLRTLGALMHRDLLIFSAQFKDRGINGIAWITMSTWVMHVIMPEMGLAHMGAFMAIANVSSSGFWEVGENVSKFAADLEGERAISYYLTLPISQNMIFIKMAFTNAIQALIIACAVLPFAVASAWPAFDGSSIVWWKAIVFFIVMHLFYGFFSLYLSSRVHSMDKLSNLYLRYMFPIYYFGSYNFTWDAMYKAAPYIAYLNLLNPMTYCMEGIRRATIGTEGMLSFSTCLVAVCFFTCIFGFFGVKSLKRKLDCM